MLAARDEATDKGTVAGGVALGAAIAVVLCFFAARRHRWPKWFLLVIVIIAIGSQIAFLDWRSSVAVFDVAALAVLLRGWSSIEEHEH